MNRMAVNISDSNLLSRSDSKILESTQNIQVNHSEINKGHALGTGVHTYTKQVLPESHLFT